MTAPRPGRQSLGGVRYKAEDWDRVRELQAEIDDVQGQLEIIRQLDAAAG
jgi:hypothetical protein